MFRQFLLLFSLSSDLSVLFNVAIPATDRTSLPIARGSFRARETSRRLERVISGNLISRDRARRFDGVQAPDGAPAIINNSELVWTVTSVLDRVGGTFREAGT